MALQETLCYVGILFVATLQVSEYTYTCGVFHFETSEITNGMFLVKEGTSVNITFSVQRNNSSEIDISKSDESVKIFTPQCKILPTCQYRQSYNKVFCQCLDTPGFYRITFIADRKDNALWKWSSKPDVQDTNITFNVTYPASIIELEIVGYNAPIPQDKSVSVFCTCENGNPPTRIYLLDRHNNVLAERNTSGNVSFTFSPVKCKHAGVIRCEANGSNKSMSTTMLIKCPPEFEKTYHIQNLNIGNNSDVTFPFRSHTSYISSCHITNMKQNTDGDINQLVTGSLKCTKLESNKTDAISENKHCLYSVTGKPPDLNLTIHVRNLKIIDGGLWSVNISNEVGSDVLNVQVNINKGSVKSSEKGDNLVGIVVSVVVSVQITISTVVIVVVTRRRRLNQKNKDTKHNGEERSVNVAFSVMTHTGKKPKVSRSTQERRVVGNESNHGDHDYNNRSVCLLEHTVSSSTHLSGDIAESPSDISNVPGRKKKKAFESVNCRDAKSQIYQNAIAHVNSEPPVVPVKPRIGKKSPKKTEEIYNDEDDDKAIYNNEDIYSSFDQISFTQLDELQRSLLAALASGHLTQKFQKLPKGMIHPHEEGLRPVNRKKNRFKALFTYDFNRVILEGRKGKTDSDYINASYIKGYQRDKAYIAAQGPRPETINDMWWMVWQEGVTQIVMLTNLKEDGKIKCEEYWPVLRSTRVYGDVSVTGVNVEQRADFIIRTFSLKVKGNKLPRNIQQYHYTAWPDHSVPTATSLVDFWRYVKARAASLVPVLVHCSARVGRTGTYIALDVAMDTSAHERDVDVHKIVADLREERTTMVQAEAQYKFLYEVILEAYTSRQTRRSLEQFEVMFPKFNIHKPNDVTDTEFKIFQEMATFVSEPQHLVAASDENKAKNRNPDALPDDSHLVYADVHDRRNNMYVNAVFAPSFRHRKGILLTQLPFPDTLEDIWRLIDDKNVDTIISISSKDEHTTVNNFCQYWPKMSRQAISTGPYTIRHVGFSVLSEYITSYHLSLKKDNIVRDIRLLHFTGWNGEVPVSTKDTLQLVETLSTNHSEENVPPVVIQCIDGAARSGLFCILWENIERAKYDRETDVYLTARRIKAIRPQAVTTEVQYRFCYKVIQDFQRQFETYQNT